MVKWCAETYPLGDSENTHYGLSQNHIPIVISQQWKCCYEIFLMKQWVLRYQKKVLEYKILVSEWVWKM